MKLILHTDGRKVLTRKQSFYNFVAERTRRSAICKREESENYYARND